MSKIGIGVGEEFPVEDAKTPPAPPPGGPGGGGREHRHGRWHGSLHILTRVAFLALVIAAIVWMFTPHYSFQGPYAQLPPRGFYPYPHHFFFFPFFPILLIALFAFAWRRRGCHRYHHHHHWHDEPGDGRRQGA